MTLSLGKQEQLRLFEVCTAHGVPAIVAMGRKGGSNVAAGRSESGRGNQADCRDQGAPGAGSFVAQRRIARRRSHQGRGNAVSAKPVVLITAADLAGLVFTPAANANGTGYASFTFSVQDSAGGFDATPNTFSVNVTAQPDAAWFLLIGQDQYANLHTWQHWDELLDRTTVVTWASGAPMTATFSPRTWFNRSPRVGLVVRSMANVLRALVMGSRAGRSPLYCQRVLA